MTTELRALIKKAAQDIFEHTKDECGKCRAPYSCCSPEYCEFAQEYAMSDWGVDLSHLRIEEQKLPFLHEGGCVVPPHLRPNCTLHTCDINSLGFKPGDQEWTQKYFDLRNGYEELMFKEFYKK